MTRKTLLLEKQGVMAGRIFPEDVPSAAAADMERAAEEITDTIEKHASDAEYEFGVNAFGLDIRVIYRPDGTNASASAYGKERLTVRKRYVPEDREELTYTLYHELLHIFQTMKLHQSGKRWPYPWLRHAPGTDNARKDGDGLDDFLKKLMYVTSANERRAFCHNAYLLALRYCRETPKRPDREIVAMTAASIISVDARVMDILTGVVSMSAGDPDNLGKPLVTFIMRDLVHFFKELNFARIAQCDFDRDIFGLPAVMRIRQKAKKMFRECPMGDAARAAADEAADRMADELREGLDLRTIQRICASFMKHMKERYEKALKAFSKAASLAIDDWRELQKGKVTD